ncbi:hypothetical protein OV450_3908 [Actinobacteria bacterium OV450]|nr:hypothetical protein OV450_3908 [Actinobacteria bacterium OV450]
MAIRGSPRRPSRANEVAVLILDDVLVDPPTPLGSRALFGSDQRGQRVLSHAQEPTELVVLVIWIQGRKLAQVQEAFIADVLDRMEIDLIGRLRRANLYIAHTRTLCRAARPKKLLDRTAPPQGPEDERLCQVPHYATLRRTDRLHSLTINRSINGRTAKGQFPLSEVTGGTGR